MVTNPTEATMELVGQLAGVGFERVMEQLREGEAAARSRTREIET